MEPISTDGDPYALLLTDREIANADLAQREEAAADVLAVIAKALDTADATLSGIERDGMLGPAIKRLCNELADTVHGVSDEIGGHSEEERREFARACLDDARAELELLEGVVATTSTATAGSNDGQEEDDWGSADGAASPQPANPPSSDADISSSRRASAAEKMTALTEDDMCAAVSTAQAILLDVEEVLRSVGQDEAEEIAEVGIAVARMFVWSLQSIQQSVTPQILAGTDEERNMASSKRQRSSRATSSLSQNTNDDGLEIEILDDSDIDEDNDDDISKDRADTPRPPRPAPSGPDRRVRVLWPPLGPAVASAGKWGADAASKNPILSVALAMALWPAALVAAFVGAPLVAVDHAIQKGYDANKDSSIVEAAERGAANLYQVGKLYYLCTKLVVKQSIRVGCRQIERRGGLGAVAGDVGSFAVDRALHPIETATWAWDSVKWGAGTVLDAAAFVKDVATGDAAIVGGVPADMH